MKMHVEASQWILEKGAKTVASDLLHLLRRDRSLEHLAGEPTGADEKGSAIDLLQHALKCVRVHWLQVHTPPRQRR